MKKNKNLPLCLAFAILSISIILISIALAKERNISYWIVVLFYSISSLMMFALLYKTTNDKEKYMLYSPSIIISFVYLLIQLVVLIISTFIKIENIKIVLVIEVVILAIYLVVVLLLKYYVNIKTRNQ